jgi:eukaryotic-like serine/threonine-protein kinase
MAQRKLNFLPAKATFSFGERIGAGTVGVVFRATSPDLDVPVAVKLLHPSVSGDQQVVDRFEREIALMERLDHPHIVRHYGGGHLDGQLFYAMQLLDRGTLKDRLQQGGPLPWPQAAAYGVQIASALQHAHNHGVVHRDLKPSNLFFDGKGNLILGDFGIARDTHAADITGSGITVGTYAYMSPEQITASEKTTPASDLYSLGCVMMEMLTGKPPFVGANFAQIWEQHLHHDPPKVRDRGVDCPEWLEELVVRLLSKHPRARPFSARNVEGYLIDHLVREFGEEQSKRLTQQLTLPPRVTSLDRPVRMWVLWVAVLVAAAVCVVAALQGR